VVVEKDRVRVIINPVFYNFDAVKEVKKEFDQLSRNVVVDESSKITVFMEPKQKASPEELETLGYEFYNHLLNAVKEFRSE